MPARPKTTDAQIVQAARTLVDSNGRDGFTMHDVAALVGIRAPSLYGRFKGRAAILAAVELDVWAGLARLLENAAVENDPAATLMAQAWAIRNFAMHNPNSYSLFFDARLEVTDDANAARSMALSRLVGPLGALVGTDGAFMAARVLVAYLHGFISIELANGFRLDGGVDTTFESGVSVVLGGLAATRPSKS